MTSKMIAYKKCSRWSEETEFNHWLRCIEELEYIIRTYWDGENYEEYRHDYGAQEDLEDDLIILLAEGEKYEV